MLPGRGVWIENVQVGETNIEIFETKFKTGTIDVDTNGFTNLQQKKVLLSQVIAEAARSWRSSLIVKMEKNWSLVYSC